MTAPTDWTLTHTGFVDTWTCDENDHLNVQFYWEHFAQGAAMLAALDGGSARPWTSRHVRYLRELRRGAATQVLSRRQSETRTVHHLHDMSDGSLSATAIDTFDHSTACDDEAARGRSLPAEPVAFDGEGDVAARFVVEPRECGVAGTLSDRGLIGRFSSGAANIWAFAGIGRDWLRANRRGTVVVEKKVTRLGPAPPAGTPIEIVSRAARSGAKTVRFDSGVRDARDRTPIYAVAMTALLMDLDARRAVALPHDLPALDHRTVYKIVPRADWTAARAAGRFEGAPIDLADGYIHLSTAAQAAETLEKHFHGQRDLLLVSVSVPRTARSMRWEVSRGGALFPHLYAPLSMDMVTGERPIAERDDGGHTMPDLGARP